MLLRLLKGLLLFCVVGLGASCTTPRSELLDAGVNVERADGPAQMGGRGGGTGGGTATGGTGGDNGGGPPVDPTCQPGFHTCNGTCVDSSKPEHCGAACEPCPFPMGGTASCDGIKCNVACPAGQKPCLDKCVDMAAACDGTCPPGQNPCNGICVDAKSVVACGRACMPCPTSANGATSCDGDKCDLACSPGYHRCGDLCVSDGDVKTCGVSCTPCTVPTGGEATCQGGQCGGKCPPDKQLCLGACIPLGQACDGRCPQGQHNCNNTCVSDTDVNSCGPANCMPCSAPANGKATCANGACDFDCTAGNKCNGKCVTAESCSNGADDDCDGQVDCADTQCTAGTTCGNNSVCRGGTCVQLKERGDTCTQTSDCRSGTCVSSHCCNSGEKYCDGQCQSGGYCCDGTACNITNGKGSCQGGSCQLVSCNTGYKPQGANQCIDACTGVTCGPCQACSNGQCVANDGKGGCTGCDRCSGGRCVSSGQVMCDGQCRSSSYCCTGDSCSIANGTGRCVSGSCQRQSCNDGYEPQGNQCVRSCGGSGEPCCGDTCNSGDLYCDGTNCKPRKPDGSPCGNRPNECRSRCVAGICCASQCCSDNACADNKVCESGSCIDVTCPNNETYCHTISNHQCRRKAVGTECSAGSGRCGEGFTEDCRSDGIFVCKTPVRSGTSCCVDSDCFPGISCVGRSGSTRGVCQQ
jgi:hypothetical protein